MDIASLTLLGLIQGLTEFLPVSSTGHLILARELFGFGDALGLAEDAVLHLATALAVVVYFWKDLVRLFMGSVEALRTRQRTPELTMSVALLLATIPAVVAGLFFESSIASVLRGSAVVAGGLVVGSLVFVGAEYFGKNITSKKTLTVRGAVGIGLFQALALIPGMSRSGMVISGGLFLGLSRFEAARFGFLLSFPIILGAGILKLYELLQSGALVSVGVPLFWGAIVAFASGMLAIHTLLRFVRTHSLMPFVVYRLLLALVIVVSLSF